MYSFLRSPRWIVGHVIVVAAVILFLNLGLWQLRRHDEQRRYNDELAAHQAAPAVLVTGSAVTVPEYSPARATGSYDTSRELVVRPRARDGVPGQHVLTPLLLDSGEGLLVVRGWTPLEAGDAPVDPVRPPEGQVSVMGVLLASEGESGLGPRNPEAGEIVEVRRIDVPRLAGQFPYPLHPQYLVLTGQQPATTGPLEPVEPPQPSQRSNLAYAVQWFSFAGVVVVGYAALLRKTAGSAGQEEPSLRQRA